MAKKRFSLRTHQKEAVKSILASYKDGFRKPLAVLATGSGKTIIYLYLANKWALAGKRILILAHRRELIHQPIDRAKQFFPILYSSMGIVMAEKDEAESQVTVATIQTATRSDRLADDYDYVILDECHHATAHMYQKMFRKFSKAKWLGLTATPFRHDGDTLSGLFDSVAYRFPITSAIEKGVLVPFEAYGFTLPLTFEGVTETMDGWAEKELDSLLSATNAIEVVYEKWKEYCENRQTICFTASVGQAYATAKFFRSKGCIAEAVDGSTPKKQRDGILNAFRKGDIQVVCNCQVWTEGVDVPEASAALMVCPTKSDLAYVQKLGRILRTFKGKSNAIVLDFAPMDDRNVIMAGDIIGGEPFVEKQAKEKAEKSGLLVKVSKVNREGVTATIDPSEVLVELLKYLRKGFLAWVIQDEMAVASLSDSVMMAIQLPDPRRIGKAEALRRTKNWNNTKERFYQYLTRYKLWICKRDGSNWKAELVGAHLEMEKASELSTVIINENYQPHLAKKRRAWRGRPSSDKQQSFMKYLNIDIPESCTQGQAAQLISYALANKTVSSYNIQVEKAVLADKIQFMENQP